MPDSALALVQSRQYSKDPGFAGLLLVTQLSLAKLKSGSRKQAPRAAFLGVWRERPNELSPLVLLPHPSSFEQFEKEFQSEILQSSDDRHNQRLDRYWSRTTVDTTGTPRLVLCPKSSKDVALALRYSKARKEDISIITGGHWVGKNCGTGLLIELNWCVGAVRDEGKLISARLRKPPQQGGSRQ